MKTGDYYKLVGDYAGCYWNGRAWIRFECEACVRACGRAKNRLQGPMSNGAHAAMLGPVIFRHDAKTHQRYLEEARKKGANEA